LHSEAIMKLLTVSLLIFAFSAATAQEIKHAPTLESCTADINLWTSQFPAWPNPPYEKIRAATKDLTSKELNDRTNYMFECGSAYPQLSLARSGQVGPAFSPMFIYDAEVSSRYLDFIARHALLNKFNEEDKAGER
jgi:hypothetical protein